MATDLEKICSQPVFFERNRVFRNYKGGGGFLPLMGDATGDNDFPEEWLASKVKAINPVYFGERDGVSVVEGTGIFFDDLLSDHSERLLPCQISRQRNTTARSGAPHARLFKKAFRVAVRQDRSVAGARNPQRRRGVVFRIQG